MSSKSQRLRMFHTQRCAATYISWMLQWKSIQSFADLTSQTCVKLKNAFDWPMSNHCSVNIYLKMSLPDNSKFEKLVRNRPPLSVLPPPNKRLVSQFLARSLFTTTSFILCGSIFLYKFYINANSEPILKTRKEFSFEADPYSSQVSCNHRDIPNRQHDYWVILKSIASISPPTPILPMTILFQLQIDTQQ